MSEGLRHADFYVLRSPLLPYHTVTNVDADAIRTLCKNPVVQEALFIASPELYGTVVSWLEKEPGKADEISKLELTLLKYILRMSYRCTPFGIFAGITPGKFATTSGIQLAPRMQNVKHSRLDMDFLCALALNISNDPAVRSELLFFPNNTLYRAGTQLRYVEYRIHKKTRTHHLVTVAVSDALQRVLTHATNGARIKDLAALLVRDDIPLEDALTFVIELITSQVLVSELGPFITGEEYIHKLIQILRKYPGTQAVGQHLERVVTMFESIDHADLGASISSYKDLMETLEVFKTPFEPAQLFQVDMLKPAVANTLSKVVTDQLQHAIQLLARVHPATDPPSLIAFRDAFIKRYELRECPLLEVLDVEMGIGYPVNNIHAMDHSPLLEDLMIGTTAGDPPAEWNEWYDFLLRKCVSLQQQDSRTLALEEEDIKPFLHDNGSLPDSLYTMGSVLADDAAAVDRGDFLVQHTVTTGPSAANLLGRFCYLDEGLTHQVSNILRHEEAQHADVCYAEVVHINQSRIGNIALRPLLRAYEIPIMVQAGVQQNFTIPLDDLMISIRQEKIVLRSRRLNKYVVPRLSTAHNYSHDALPYYHFLCDLQFQGVKRDITWRWGPLRKLDFLPRVMIRNVVVSKARWTLREDVLKRLKGCTFEKFSSRLRAVISDRKINRHVTLSDGDHELPLDLQNEFSLRLLQSLLATRPVLTLEENLFATDNLFVQSDAGGFTNEFIIPWATVREQLPRPQRLPHSIPVTRARTFAPGSEWLYMKIYTGLKTSDRVLAEIVKPLTAEFLRRGIIDQWFFIRFNDPDDHLRVRFHGTGKFYSCVLEAFHTALLPLLETGEVVRVAVDTYEREIERYGAETIGFAEQLFFVDSVAIADVIALLEGDEGDVLRWQFALRAVDDMLRAAQCSLEQRRGIMNALQAAFKKEFQAEHADSRKQLGNKFRKERPFIDAFLRESEFVPAEFSPVWSVLERRADNLSEVFEKLRAELDENRFMALLESYIHMTMNRFFRSRQRLHELVIYDLLWQYYNSALARQKKSIAVVNA